MQSKRYFLEVSYLGTNFHGWQKQKNALTVQEEFEKRISQYFNQTIEVVASGRTDAGVHASKQVVHLDVPPILDLQKMIYALNRMLPKDISIQDIYEVAEDAHARFDAIRRGYTYHILRKKNPFLSKIRTVLYQDFEVEKMNEACQYLLGKQDFESFSKVHTDVNTFDCEIFEAKWTEKEGELIFYIAANRFLRGMVRTIVGTLLEVGLGKKDPTFLKEVIAAKDRKAAGRSAPAEGLFLCEVKYPHTS